MTIDGPTARPAGGRRVRAATAVVTALALLAACASPAPDPVPARPSAGQATTGTAAPSTAPTPTSTSATTAAPLAMTDTDTAARGPAPGAAPQHAAATGFVSGVQPIDATLAARMAPSWRPGCPVPLADLRYVTVTHVGFDGADHPGELVVSARTADAIVSVFAELYRQRFPIASMRLVDDFAIDGMADDAASMAANNTSAFNCRAVTGGSSWSEHSSGEAIDINPVQNPYVSSSGAVQPAAGAAFLPRSPGPGVILPGDPVVQAFARIGWSWGGAWTSPVDHQHFSASGR
ncbi:M15 family metallopeptidase [Nakamurella leprariae]|uniref:M15 family metallopeptidase n=1 Tax=Nakamurella leprariae TaxID=2803911 RepID=A0A938YAQ5_9ACTN|nr:M15 family metallopeptidase [Nakamurella leprariae]MBM9466324.1 M15 family metallopeptidase [Nakamurella leprariae]